MYQYIPTDINNFCNEEHEHQHSYEYHPQASGFQGIICPYTNQNGTMMYRNPDSSHESNMMMHPHHHLLNTVQHCEAVCEHTTHMLKQKHDIHMRMKQLTLLRDCADICTLMAKYLARMSEFSKALAKLCAKICEDCGKECEKFRDHESQYCAKVCLHCAEKCKDFAD